MFNKHDVTVYSTYVKHMLCTFRLHIPGVIFKVLKRINNLKFTQFTNYHRNIYTTNHLNLTLS